MGGIKQDFLYTINRIEPRPLHHAVRESIQIAALDLGPTNMDRCQEWGQPRVPIVVAMGGDQDGTVIRGVPPNPRPEWSKRTLQDMQDGKIKRVTYWDEREEQREQEKEDQPQPKHARMDMEQQSDPGEEVQGLGDGHAPRGTESTTQQVQDTMNQDKELDQGTQKEM